MNAGLEAAGPRLDAPKSLFRSPALEFLRLEAAPAVLAAFKLGNNAFLNRGNAPRQLIGPFAENGLLKHHHMARFGQHARLHPGLVAISIADLAPVARFLDHQDRQALALIAPDDLMVRGRSLATMHRRIAKRLEARHRFSRELADLYRFGFSRSSCILWSAQDKADRTE